MKGDALKRAKKAIKNMEKGMPITEACHRAGTTYVTVRRAMRTLKKHYRTKLSKTARGRKRIIIDAYRVEKAKCVARLMQFERKSASEAVRECHTRIGTVKDAQIDGCKLLRHVGNRYRLQVFEVRKYGVVFFGRLKNVGSPVAITYSSPFNAPSTLMANRSLLRSDDYASIMWQYDFNEFHSTLSPKELCDYYLELVLEFLSREVQDRRVSKTIVSWLARFGTQGLATLVDAGILTQQEADDILAGRRPYNISVLEEIFKLGVVLDEDIKCGVDDRTVTSEWVCKSTIRKRNMSTDIGYFQVLVLRRSSTSRYPATPKKIPYHHSLLEEISWIES